MNEYCLFYEFISQQYMTMMNNLILVSLTIMTILHTQQKELRMSYSIVDSQSVSNDDSFEDKQNQKIIGIHLFQCQITEQGLSKMFSFDLTYLKVLNFTRTSLNPKLARMLLTQPFISNLSVLILDKCDLSCQDLAALQFTTSISKLSLKLNFISHQGMTSLSKLPLNLVSLNLFGNSLVHNQSISALKSMNFRDLLDLNLGKTGISEQNLLKLLAKIGTQKIVNLTISHNIFSALFYRELASMNFDSLKYLDLTDLEIDHDGFKNLANLKLPSLQQLNIQNNRLQTNTAKLFLTNKTMPSLHALNLNANFVDWQIFQHLHAEKFVFTDLRIKIIAMTYPGLEKISIMDLSRLQIFEFGDCTVNPETLDLFFTKSKLPQLRVLRMNYLSNSGDLLSYILKSSLPKLQELQIGDIGKIGTFLGSNRNQVKFGKLNQIRFRHYSLNCSELKVIMPYLLNIAPGLKIVEIVAIEPTCLIESILNQTFHLTLTNSLRLTLSKMASVVTYSAVSKSFQVILNLNKKHQIVTLEVSKIYNMISAYQLITNRVKTQPFPGTLEYFQKLNIFINESFSQFDFDQLRFLGDTSYLFFLSWFEKHNNFKCSLPNLNTLRGLIANNQNLNLMHRCTMPSIFQLALSFLSFVGVKAQIPSYKHLKFIYFQNIPVPTLRNIFDTDTFQNLQYLVLPANKLTPEDMRAILKQVTYPHKIRQLNLMGNFLNADLSFISKDMKLLSFNLNNILMPSGTVNQLCEIDYQFLEKLQLSNTGLDDKNFISLIECINNRTQNKGFSKLKIMNLTSNYLEGNGFQTFMSSRLPLLEQFSFKLNKDPEIFNSIFKHNSSRRLKAFISSENYLSSIDASINPTYTKRLKNLMIESTTIRSTDLEVLSKLQLSSLVAVMLKLQRIDSCESLGWIQTITQNAGFVIDLSKSSGINSSCLQSKKNVRVSPINVLVQIEYPYGQARHFIEYFFNKDQHLNMIHMSGVYISDEKLIQIARDSDCQKVELINLEKNDLSDHAIRNLLDRQYPLLKGLTLSGNPRLTGSALTRIEPLHFPALRNLNLGKTSIGDRGVQLLVRVQYPQLNVLTLKDSDITKIGLLHLNKIQSPMLVGIDLSCNDLSVDDLVLLEVDNFPKLKFIVLYPSLKSSDLTRLQTKYNRNKNSPITILTTVESQPLQL